jgi:excisionase family DNA binding protein
VNRGKWFTLDQAGDAYPAIGRRMFRRLVQERRLPFSRVGRRILVAEHDIDSYLDATRVEPARMPPHIRRLA